MLELIAPQLLEAIREVLYLSRSHLQQTVNSSMVQAYWQVGQLIVEQEQRGVQRAAYGKQQLEQLSKKLQSEFGKGFDISNLRNMRKFYHTFPIQDAVRPELTWTHYRTLLRIEDYLRDPYILDFLNLPSQTLLENNLEQGLIDNLQQFLLELGKGFAFVKRQQRISTDDQDFYIDLVFYNFKLKCFLLIDLKLGKLTHQDAGQMDSYVRIYDQHKKSNDDNPTIGLILCSQKSEAVAKYSVLTDSKQLFASKYLSYLPSEEELRLELERERALILEKK